MALRQLFFSPLETKTGFSPLAGKDCQGEVTAQRENWKPRGYHLDVETMEGRHDCQATPTEFPVRAREDLKSLLGVLLRTY